MKAKIQEEIVNTLWAILDFTIVIWREKLEFLALRVHFLLILLHRAGKDGDLDTQSEGSNVELSQTPLSNLGLAGYGTQKSRTKSWQQELSINIRGHGRKTEAWERNQREESVTFIRCEIGKNNLFNGKCPESTYLPVKTCFFSYPIDWGY